VLQYTVCCSMLQCGAVCYSVLQCIVVCCSVLQCVAVRHGHRDISNNGVKLNVLT